MRGWPQSEWGRVQRGPLHLGLSHGRVVRVSSAACFSPFLLLPDVEVMVPLFLGLGPGPGFRSELLLSQSAALGLSLERPETWF